MCARPQLIVNHKQVTGITGVIMVAPNRPGPVRKGSESPNAAQLPKRKVYGYER